PEICPSQEKTTLSFLIAPVLASTFSMPKIFWRATIIGSAATAAHDTAIAPAAASARINARCFMTSPVQEFRSDVHRVRIGAPRLRHGGRRGGRTRLSIPFAAIAQPSARVTRSMRDFAIVPRRLRAADHLLGADPRVELRLGHVAERKRGFL